MVREFISRNAGASANDLLHSKTAAWKLLTHQESIVRACALDSCYHIWNCGSDSAFIEVVVRAITSDPNEVVKAFAIRIVHQMLSKQKHRAAEKALASIVVDERNSNSMRLSAYIALWEIEYGDISGIWNQVVEDANAGRERRPPGLEELDWGFVRKFVPLKIDPDAV